MVILAYNGHAKKGEEFRNDMTNFGISNGNQRY
jgi:hypothetical protein